LKTLAREAAKYSFEYRMSHVTRVALNQQMIVHVTVEKEVLVIS
jgi:hypothetical protein